MRVLENIVEFAFGSWRIRVWFDREESGPSIYEDRKLLGQVFRKWQNESTGGGSDWEIHLARYLERELTPVRKVNAIQVGMADGCGVLIYPEWP